MAAIEWQVPVTLPTAVNIRVFGCKSPDGRTTFGFTIVGLLLIITNHEYTIIRICICTINSTLLSVSDESLYAEYRLCICNCIHQFISATSL